MYPVILGLHPKQWRLNKALAGGGWPAPVLLAFTHGVLGPVAMAILLRAGDSLGWDFWSWSLLSAALAVAALDLVLAGVFVRVGGQLLKGPYLPQTTAGLSKTTRALLGR